MCVADSVGGAKGQMLLLPAAASASQPETPLPDSESVMVVAPPCGRLQSESTQKKQEVKLVLLDGGAQTWQSCRGLFFRTSLI